MSADIAGAMSTAGGLSNTAAAAVTRLVREGPQPLTALANGEGVSQPAMTQLISRLERDGLVARIASANDRRVVLVEVTDAGADIVRQRRTQRAEVLGELLNRLEADERAAILAALPALSRLVDLAVEADGPLSRVGAPR